MKYDVRMHFESSMTATLHYLRQKNALDACKHKNDKAAAAPLPPPPMTSAMVPEKSERMASAPLQPYVQVEDVDFVHVTLDTGEQTPKMIAKPPPSLSWSSWVLAKLRGPWSR